ncbi:3-oxo-5-alpha-steroid 4-dehydrogenase-domain-containing protein [Crepidotus variabilis]|uniref:3-oxo-5-alpha-steroid 4-dehydrogenase-domain-containing protein n=1 Tax=Crepidotus variabilis TaxID=179855 RepID=A0A9P6EPU1_9AGAR|nr:3-oxo-5-alpha-steroid 4-dehydrogenase-domain-containing protein [Crepidotus variabilis]
MGSKPGKQGFSVEVPATASVADLKSAIALKKKHLYPSRQRLSLVSESSKRLTDETKLTDISNGLLKDGLEFKLKDLGPQISWTTVFLVEYAGPLLIHPLFFYCPKLWYGKNFEHSALQKYVFAFVMLHFLKRELETLFVHRFSHATMPWFNIVKNSGHYHILSGVLLAFDIYRPKYSATSPYILNTIRNDEQFLWICTGIWLYAELSNLHTHLKVRSLRPPGSTKRAIPYGYGFNLVSLPNYFFEIIAWTTISVMTNSAAAWLFTIVATGQMALWAIKKHKNYKKEFGKEYPRARKAMIPFLL